MQQCFCFQTWGGGGGGTCNDCPDGLFRMKMCVAEKLSDPDVPSQQRIEEMIRIAEQCIDLLKENDEHHGEARFSCVWVAKQADVNAMGVSSVHKHGTGKGVGWCYGVLSTF